MKNCKNYSYVLFVITILNLMLFSGCFSVKPNKPFDGEYPSTFKELESKNPLLAKELGKIPEMQDGISQNDTLILEEIVELYRTNRMAVDKLFDQMYQVGMPEVRKFCSPLQALFWLCEDGELKKNMDLVYSYNLKALLDKTWSFDASMKISEDQITKIVTGIENKNMREDYLARRKRLSTPMFLKEINAAYTKNKSVFSDESIKIIESVKDSRWENFDIVTDRLNAPELIDYYERKRFNYVHWKSLPQPSVSPNYVFKYNIGECVSITAFTVFCLRKAGYSAIEIREAGHNADFHALTLFEMNGEKYLMDNGRPTPGGIRPYVKSELAK